MRTGVSETETETEVETEAETQPECSPSWIVGLCLPLLPYLYRLVWVGLGEESVGG